jgi:protein-S-isoprenylcysteine O-methyltransferase Ste14
MQSILSMLAFALMVFGIIGFYYTNSLFTASPVVIALQLLSVALMIWARRTFGTRSFHAEATPTEGGLVTSGPYRYLRHPIYTAVLFFVWPPAIARGAAAPIVFAALISIGAIIRMLCEEYLLARQYPAYDEYAKSTKRIIPYLF